MRNLRAVFVLGWVVAACGGSGGGGEGPTSCAEVPDEAIVEHCHSCSDTFLDQDGVNCCPGCEAPQLCDEDSGVCEAPPEPCIGTDQVTCISEGMCGSNGTCLCRCEAGSGLTCSSDGIAPGTCEEGGEPSNFHATIGVAYAADHVILQGATWEFIPGTATEVITHPTATSTIDRITFGANPFGTTTYQTPGDGSATDGTDTMSAPPGENMTVYLNEIRTLGDVGDPITLTLAAGASTPAITFTVPKAGVVQLSQMLHEREIARDAVLHIGFVPTTSGTFRATFQQAVPGGNVLGSVWTDASTGSLDVPVVFLSEFQDGDATISYDIFNEMTGTFGAYAASGYTKGTVNATNGFLAFSDAITFVPTAPPPPP